jgi:hypothetical protein
MTMALPFARRRVLRGAPYSLEDSKATSPAPGDGKKLFQRFGPSSGELDLLMASKKTKPSLYR